MISMTSQAAGHYRPAVADRAGGRANKTLLDVSEQILALTDEAPDFAAAGPRLGAPVSTRRRAKVLTAPSE